MSSPMSFLDNVELYSGIGADTDMSALGFGGSSGFGSSSYNSVAPQSSSNGFGNFLNAFGGFLGGSGGGGLLGGFGQPANNPIGTSQQAGNQLAYNLGQSAQTAALAAQGLGIRGQLLGAGTGFAGEDAQLNRETTAILRGQQLNQTNLARQNNAQQFKVAMAGRMNPQAIARASAMAYGV